jgi:hypothetical protein
MSILPKEHHVYLAKRIAAGTVVAVLGAGVALPAVSAAATTTTVTQTSNYRFVVDRGVLAGGGHHVRAKVVVTNPQANVSDWYSRSTVRTVVRKAANRGIQKPFRSQGYRCVPVLEGSMNATTARYTCTLRGADVPTTVELTFTIRFKPPVA